MTKLVHAERVTDAIVVRTEPGQPNTGSMPFYDVLRLCYIFYYIIVLPLFSRIDLHRELYNICFPIITSHHITAGSVTNSNTLLLLYSERMCRCRYECV